jgi:hypothetical protein
VVLPRFWLTRRDSTSSNTGVGFVLFFVVISLLDCYFDDHWWFSVGYVSLFALVFLPLQSTVVVLVILTAATYPTTSHRRFVLRALSFASFSATLSLYHILADPLYTPQNKESFSYTLERGEWMDNKECSPKHRRGESEWIRLCLMDSTTFYQLRVQHVLGWSTRFYQWQSWRLHWW